MRPHPSATTVDICDYTKPEPCHKPDVRTEPILEFKASVQYIEKVKRASYFGNIVDDSSSSKIQCICGKRSKKVW